MKISIKQLLTLLVLTLLTLMSVILYIGDQRKLIREQVSELEQKAFIISEQANRLNVIVADFNFYHSTNSLTKWSKTLDKIERQSVELLFLTQQSDQSLAKRLDTDIYRIRQQFELLKEASIEKDIQWITINLNTYSQNLITHLHNLSEQTRILSAEELSRLSSYQELALSVTTFFALALLLVLYTALFIPLKTVKSELKKIGDGTALFKINKPSIKEWYELTVSLEAMYQKLRATTVSRKELLDEVEMRKQAELSARELARTDYLTGLPNRMRFFEYFQFHDLSKQEEGYLLFLDIDNLKSVNDNLGHIAGDQLLRSVSQVILRTAYHGDNIARLGGDEFAILHYCESESEVLEFASNLQQAIAEPILVDGTHIRARCSIGIAGYPQDGDEIKELLSCADTAMYFAKRNPVTTSGIVRFTTKLGDLSRHLFTLQHQLRRAVELQEFQVWFQPQIDIKTMQVSGFEALLRWQDPDGRSISPDVFVPLLEKSVDIVKVGEMVFDKAILFHRMLRKLGYDLSISINVSAVQLEREDFISSLQLKVLDSGHNPAHFPLELTETAIFKNKERTLKSLYELRKLGFKLQLDDFGTGNASLDLLKSFPFDTVKIDKSFTQEAVVKAETKAIIKAITLLSNDLAFDVIIEGVETKEHQVLAMDYQIRSAQGYYYSPAMLSEDAIRWLMDYQRYAEVM